MKAIARITLREMTEDERPDAELSMFPDAHETLDRLKELGIKLALITNGAAEPQRAKVVRFALEQRFDHIQIEASTASASRRSGPTSTERSSPGL